MEKQKETAEIDIISLNDVCKISVSEKVVIPLTETFHEEIEIKLCLSGCFYVAISDNVLKHEPGNISIVNPYEVHSIFSGIEEGQTGEYCCLIIGLNCLDYIENQDVKEGLKKGTIKFNNFIEKDERIQEIIEHIVYEEKGNYLYKNWVLKSLIVELFALLLRDQQQGSLLNEGSNLALRDLIAPSLSYIHINYASKITLEKLSGLCNFSKNHFCRIFKTVTRLTPFQYINAYRVNIASVMLKSSQKSCQEIAYLCGFEDESYFSRCYKRIKGISPTKDRK